MVLPALIAAGASLVGGAANRNAQRKANEKNRPVNQVEEWEEAGINPLFGISSGGYIPHQAASIGDSFATAGGIFADHLARKEETDLRKTQMELENQRLKKELDKVANPSEPGHMETYGGILPLPSNGGYNASNQGNSSAISPRNGDGLSFGSTLDRVATGRELEVAPYTSGPGFTEIDNDLTGPIIVPGADGEPWGIDELATYMVSVPFNLAHRAGGAIRDTVDDYRTRRKMREIYRSVKSHEEPMVIGDEWGDSLPRSIKPTQQEIDDFNFRRSVIGG